MDYRKLHAKSGSHDPYGYWLHEKWIEFRRIYGLIYPMRSKEESKAFDQWIYKQLRKKKA